MTCWFSKAGCKSLIQNCLSNLEGVALQVELVDAQRIAEERARELAVANSLVAEKTREYAELQRFVTESEQTAAGMDEKFKMQMLETRQERYDMFTQDPGLALCQWTHLFCRHLRCFCVFFISGYVIVLKLACCTNSSVLKMCVL